MTIKHQPNSKVENSPLEEFWRFVTDCNNVYAQIAKFAVAAPLLDLILNIGSPWPTRVGVGFCLVVVQLLIIMCSFAIWRQGRGKIYGIKRWLVASTIGFVAFFLLVYLPLFAFFVVPSPDYRNAVVRGFYLQPPIAQFVEDREKKGETWPPKALIAHFVDGTHDETSIWTPGSVFLMRSIVLVSWLVAGMLYAISVSAFVSLQYRKLR